MRNKLIEIIVKNGCEEYGGNSRCDGNCFDRCGTCVPFINLGNIADYLISNGVIVPPCKVGQTVFFYTCVCDEVGKEKYDTLEGEVISFSLQKEGLWAYCRYKCGLTYWHLVEQDFGKAVFITLEEAEKALAERSENERRTDN